MSDPETLAVYAEKAQEYASLTNGDNAADPQLQAFIADMPPGGSVLDLGCGPGMSAAVMARAGLVVTAWDPVPEMVAIASSHPGVSARVAGFEDLSGMALFNGIWANFSMLHADRKSIPLYLIAIADMLKPGGVFHIAVKEGTGTHRDPIGRFYTYFTDEELSALLQDAGLSVKRRATGTGKGLDGLEAQWISLAAHG